jgi:nucleoside-triphosphatase
MPDDPKARRGKAYLLTGEPRVGKTTAIKYVLDSIERERCGGFYTEEMLDTGDQRFGFRLITLEGERTTLALAELRSNRIGKYGVSLQALDIGITAINQALAYKEFVVIDEIGPMQMLSPAFQQAVLEVLRSAVPLIGTVSFSIS